MTVYGTTMPTVILRATVQIFLVTSSENIIVGRILWVVMRKLLSFTYRNNPFEFIAKNTNKNLGFFQKIKHSFRKWYSFVGSLIESDQKSYGHRLRQGPIRCYVFFVNHMTVVILNPTRATVKDKKLDFFQKIASEISKMIWRLQVFVNHTTAAILNLNRATVTEKMASHRAPAS